MLRRSCGRSCGQSLVGAELWAVLRAEPDREGAVGGAEGGAGRSCGRSLAGAELWAVLRADLRAGLAWRGTVGQQRAPQIPD